MAPSLALGITIFGTDQAIHPARLAREAEERGFHSFYVPEHTHIPTSRLSPPPTGEAELAEEYKRTLDPFIALAAAVAGPGAPFDYRSGFDWRILAGIALIVAGVVGLVVWQRSRGLGTATDSPEMQRDLLIDQIAALDDEFEAGSIDEVNYTAKRARLKERLLKLM